MNGRLLMIVLAALGVLAGCQSPGTSDMRSQLPPSNEGFHWEVFDEIGVAIPSPNGWHRAVSQSPGAYTGSVSAEDFNKEGLFKTGFTVQYIPDVKKRSGQPASLLAMDMGQKINDARENELLEKDSLKERGAFRSCLIRYRNSPVLGNKITVHKFFIAWDSRDRLYIFTFESPNESWDQTFTKYGMPMMEQIVIDQNR